MATAAAAGQATATYPVLRVSAVSAEPLPLTVTSQTLTGKTFSLEVHEGTTVEHFKLMVQQSEGEVARTIAGVTL